MPIKILESSESFRDFINSNEQSVLCIVDTNAEDHDYAEDRINAVSRRYPEVYFALVDYNKSTNVVGAEISVPGTLLCYNRGELLDTFEYDKYDEYVDVAFRVQDVYY